MPKKKLPRSIRKFLRRRKAEIRRQFLSPEEAEAEIRELVLNVHQQHNGEEVTKVTKVAKGTKDA